MFFLFVLIAVFDILILEGSVSLTLPASFTVSLTHHLFPYCCVLSAFLCHPLFTIPLMLFSSFSFPFHIHTRIQPQRLHLRELAQSMSYVSSFHSLRYSELWTSEMAQRLKALEANPDDPSSIWETHVVEEENWIKQVVSSPLHMCTHTKQTIIIITQYKLFWINATSVFVLNQISLKSMHFPYPESLGIPTEEEVKRV